MGIDEVWALITPNGKLNEGALQQHCREKLAPTHVPVRFVNVAEIPRNAHGKIDRNRLNAMVQGFQGSGADQSPSLLKRHNPPFVPAKAGTQFCSVVWLSGFPLARE